MSSTIQIRVEDELRKKSDELFKKLGTDTTSAIRIFLTQAIMNDGFPFEVKVKKSVSPYIALTEDEMMEKLEKGRKSPRKSADLAVEEMRSKYGL